MFGVALRVLMCMRSVVVLQGVSIEKLEDLYASAMDYGVTLVTISHDPGTLPRVPT